jgi:hypothetical protein
MKGTVQAVPLLPPPRTTILLGAGCTYGTLCNSALCPPTVRGFGAYLRKYFRDADYTNLAEVARHLNRNIGELGLDELWSCVDYYRKFTQKYGGFLQDRAWLTGAICELKRILLRVYGSDCETASRAMGNATRCTLVSLLKRVKCGDAIISFNYDTLVERLARKFRVPLRHDEAGKAVGRSIRFAKPHGSVSWRVKDAHPRGRPLLQTLTAASVLEGCSASEPLLLGVVPIKSELIREVQCYYRASEVFDLVMRQWQVVVEAIRDADVVVVVGYSFPPEDQYGQFLFREAVRARRKALRRIEYYDVDRRCEERIREIFGKGTKIVWKGKATPARRRND